MARRIKFVVYQDEDFLWRWSLKSSNGKIIADSGEGYGKRSHCLRMVGRIIDYAMKAIVVIEESE